MTRRPTSAASPQPPGRFLDPVRAGTQAGASSAGGWATLAAVPHGRLTSAFVDAGGPAPLDAERHEALLRGALASARAAWPRVTFDEAALARWLGARWRGGAVLAHAADLALAQACAAGHAAAHEALHALVARLARVLRRLAVSRVDPEDVQQALLDKLLVPRPGGPAIARYEGAGPLEGWLRSGLVRTALNLERQGRHEDPTDLDELARATALAGSPELAFVRAKYRPEFATAFRYALGALSSRDRNLLRFHHLDGVTLDALATMYKVHRATVARWLAAARERAMEGTREALQATLRIPADELSSLMRSLQSQLHESLEGALRS